MADPMRPQGEKIAGQGRSGNDLFNAGDQPAPMAREGDPTLGRGLAGQRKLAEVPGMAKPVGDSNPCSHVLGDPAGNDAADRQRR